MLGKSFEAKLIFLYGESKGKSAFKELKRVIEASKPKIKSDKRPLWSQRDVALITYPDSFQEKNTPTLKTLNKFLRNYLKNSFSIVHILPFYTYSADRGFSVVDYLKVKKEFGSWSDIRLLSDRYRLMADFVANHVSRKNKWFQGFLKGKKRYRDYFIWFSEDNMPSEDQIKMVRRGRATPLLTPFKTKNCMRYLWTTYSIGSLIDQIDLNYKNPTVFLEMTKIFTFYLKSGVNILRFDGAGGLWKQLGTSCKHLPQAHTIISLFREVIEEISPGTLLFTETTTASPEENISYLNNKEAHVVYNFSLAPLVLFSYYAGDTGKLSQFVKTLNPTLGNTFFNVLDIHDGINTYSASHVLSQGDIQTVVDGVSKRGGTFSYRSLPNGDKAVKEMHITWWSALNIEGEEDFEMQLKKFITSRAIAMAIKGIPGVYYLSLFGAKNDLAAFNKTKHGRDINRTSLSYVDVLNKMSDKTSLEFKVFNELMDLVQKRKSMPAFHPDTKQQVLNFDKRVFAILRGTGKNKVIALHNVSKDQVRIKYRSKSYNLEPYSFIWQKL